MMKAKDWIIKELINRKYDVGSLYNKNDYERFLNETTSNSSFLSYYKQLRRYYNEINEDGTFNQIEMEDENEEEYKHFQEDYLLEILEKEIQKRKYALSLDDVKNIAEEKGIPYRAFLYQIPDLKKILKELYNINLFHIQNDKEVDKVKHENKVIKKELKYYKENDVKDEKLLEVLSNVVEEYTPFKFNPPYINKNNFNSDSEAAVQLSDWHFDELVDYEQMLGINEFSVAIAKKRIDKLFKNIVKNSQIFGITTINLLMLGDMISGELHDLAENNELKLIESILQLSDYTAQHIRNLTKYFDKIKILGLVGNHSRTHQKPRYKNKQKENYEYLLYEVIKREVKKFATFDLPGSYMKLHEIQDIPFLSLHGDIIRGGNGLNAIPGNLSRDISLLAGTLGKSGKRFDYVNMAHFHSSNITKAFQGAKIIMNGSLIGANEFSLGALKKGEEPIQNYYIVQKGVGVRFIDEIKLDVR